MRYREPFAEAIPIGRARELRGVDVVYVHRIEKADELDAFLGVPVVVASHDHDLTCIRSHRYLPLDLSPCHRAPGIACVTHGCVVVRDRRPESRLPITLRSPFHLRAELHRIAARAPIVACSEYVREHLVRAGAPRERTHVIHPIPPEDERALVPRPSAARLVVAGNLLRGKGVDIAIDALAHLPREVELVVVGEGPSKRDLERRARRFGARVQFRGWVPPNEIARAYDAASVAIVPSRWPEPFGMVGIEAMRRARPVVAAGHGGIVEWASGTKGARLFEPGDPASLAMMARALLADPGAGEQALEHARTRFPHQRLLDEVEVLLARVREEAA
jgi:glycosyltransferase involved in cell wall biosynthesis